MTAQRDQDQAAARATADVAAGFAAELATKPLTPAQQRMADRAARVASRLLKLEEQRKGARR
jgi:hypothetical protein